MSKGEKEKLIDFAFWLLHQRHRDPSHFTIEEVEEFFEYWIKEIK